MHKEAAVELSWRAHGAQLSVSGGGTAISSSQIGCDGFHSKTSLG